MIKIDLALVKFLGWFMMKIQTWRFLMLWVLAASLLVLWRLPVIIEVLK